MVGGQRCITCRYPEPNILKSIKTGDKFNMSNQTNDTAGIRKDGNEPVLLRMENIEKAFPGVKALDKVSLTVKAGTVHALMGENCAGTSTLMK